MGRSFPYELLVLRRALDPWIVPLAVIQASNAFERHFGFSSREWLLRVSGDTHSGTSRNPNALADNFGPSYLMFTQSLLHFIKHYFQPDNLPILDMRLGSRRSHTNSTSQTPLQGTSTNGLATTTAFDPFVTAPAPLPGTGVGTVPGNPYSPDTAAAAATAAALNGAAFFANQSGFQQPVSQYPVCLPRLI